MGGRIDWLVQEIKEHAVARGRLGLVIVAYGRCFWALFESVVGDVEWLYDYRCERSDGARKAIGFRDLLPLCTHFRGKGSRTGLFCSGCSCY